MDIQKLKEENEMLKKKLQAAKSWMSKEVKNQIQDIGKGNINENIEETIQKQIENFFSDIILMNLPEAVIQNIITSEINYHHMIEGEHIGGSSVIIGYNKALDILIEKNITQTFRKFAKKTGQVELRTNTPLEKSIHLVVNKGYILSTGRLYHMIDMIKKDTPLNNYSLCFKKYLDKYPSIRDVVLSETFTNNFQQLIKTEVLGKKRHTGNVSKDETIKVRKLLIGDFKNQDCMIYSLIKTQAMEF